MKNETWSMRRLALCGLAAGAVHFALTGLANAIILSEDLRAWMVEAGTTLHPLAPPTALVLWATMSACYGLIGLWYYAGIRSRRGARPSTALLLGVSMWVVTKATVALDLLTL